MIFAKSPDFILLCYFYVLFTWIGNYSIVNCAENKTASLSFSISNAFAEEITKNVDDVDLLFIEGEHKNLVNSIRLLELVLDYARLTLEMENHIDYFEQENVEDLGTFFSDFEKTLHFANEMKTQLSKCAARKSEIGEMTRISNEAKSTMAQLDASAKKLQIYIRETNKKWLEGTRKAVEMEDKSLEVFVALKSHILENGMLVNLNPITEQIDEVSLRTKGATVFKAGDLVLQCLKDLAKRIDKLKVLGYFDSTYSPSSIDEEVQKIIDHELEKFLETKETLQRISEETKNVLGPDTLWSYTLEVKRIINEVKIPQFLAKSEKRQVKLTRRFEDISKTFADLGISPESYQPQLHEEL